MRLVSATVHWFDSTLSTSEGVWSQADIDALAPCQMVSSGLLAREDADCVVLAKDYNPDMGTFRGVSLIPKVNITKMVRRRER
ncbi:MAG: hypothetical protein M0R06_25880 [Sphaerochaeta sp.]|jgi:hypothetical protein|nr:hypothetical protein [Sphaerochaeta sp.]